MSIYVIFYQAERVAWQEAFIVELQGCLFHFGNSYFSYCPHPCPLGQAIWRKVQDIGLATEYVSTDKVSNNVNSHICLLCVQLVDTNNADFNKVRMFVWHHLGMAHLPLEDHDEVDYTLNKG